MRVTPVPPGAAFRLPRHRQHEPCFAPVRLPSDGGVGRLFPSRPAAGTKLHMPRKKSSLWLRHLELFSIATGARPKKRAGKPRPAAQKAAKKVDMNLYTTDTWSKRYFDPNDLHFVERELFGTEPKK